jgi:Subtilase family
MSPAIAAGGGRVPGGVGKPQPTNDSLPPLGRAGSLTVGVIDTGIVLDDRGRPPAWFGAHHLSYCAAEDADAPSYPRGERLPSEGHGTFVSALVLREAPTARVRMWGVLAKDRVPTNADESTDRDDRAVMAALAALAINRAVQVVNLSFGDAVQKTEKPTGKDKERLETLEAAVVSFLDARPDVAVVAAAGNQNTADEFYPAAIPRVLAVGAVDETKLKAVEPLVGLYDPPPIAEFSNEGDWVRAYARGVDVLGPLPQAEGHQWARWSGTSFAAAVVAGRIAQIAIERGLNGAAAQEALLRESDDVPGTNGKWVRSVDTIAPS